MDLLAQAAEGFRSVDADDSFKDQALKYLKQWVSETEFAAYRPQLEWLIQKKQSAGLLDRFFQILPFGTGGRRGPVSKRPLARAECSRRDPGAHRSRGRAG